ncbi:MAG: hypothetical protein Q4A07_02440 [Coriobacteriales bacterium]|nr:hypothetical protein [Coriobacteriales bacterium]
MCKAIEDMREEARNEGIEQGIERGARETLLRNVRSLMESVGWSKQEALDMLKVPEPEQAGIIAML